jgi:hypothetical protein
MKPHFIFLFLFLTLSRQSSRAQHWMLGGNTLSGTEYLGSNNNQPLSFRAHGIELLRMDPTQYRFLRLQDNGQGIMTLQSNGTAARLNFTGNPNHVLRGNGTFGSLPWSNSGNSVFTPGNFNVGIGVLNPTEKLVVNGNILVQGTITAANLSDMGMMTADSASIERMVKINHDLKIEGGGDIQNGQEKNEISTLTQNLYIQSKPGTAANVIVGDHNNAKLGIGTEHPTEKLEVAEGNVKLHGDLLMPHQASQASGELGLAVFNHQGKLINAANEQEIDALLSAPLRRSLNQTFTLHTSGGPFISNCTDQYHFGSAIQTHRPQFLAFSWNDDTSYFDLLSTCSKVMIGSGHFQGGLDEGMIAGMKQLTVNGDIQTVNGDIQTRNIYADTLEAEKVGADSIHTATIDAQYYRRNGQLINFNLWEDNHNCAYRYGRVGVNTHNPMAMMHIYQAPQAEPLWVSGTTRITHTSNTQQNISFACDGSNGMIDFQDAQNNQNGRLLINTHSNRGTVFGGDVSIQGVVNSCKVVVEASSWCDYVFDETYKPMPLEEIEKFVKQNKHLPEVPPASEIENKKVDLFAMQQIQMKKIEELTLYMIEIKKENDSLKALLTSSNKK